MTSLVQVPSSGPKSWISVTCNQTGQYVAAGATNNPIWLSSSYGSNWTTIAVTSGVVWQSIKSDSTGKYLIGCSLNNATKGIYLSSSYGINWSLQTFADFQYYSVTSSNDGKYLACLAVSVYTSSNYGTNWTQRISNNGASSPQNIVSDSTGQYLAFSGSSNVFTSTNYGVSWSSPGTAIGGGFLASDSTGRYLVFVASYTIKTSNNYGVSWTSQTSTPITSLNWQSVCSDSTGAILFASASGDKIYKSSNYGVNWTALSSTTANWYLGITCDSTGQNVYANALSNSLYAYVSYIAPPDPTITPAATQNITLSIATNTATIPSSISNSSGTLTYSLDGPSTSIASITTSSGNGIVSITGPGTINVYITQAAASGYAAVTTLTLAATITVIAVPAIRPANAQTVSYPATTSATVTATSNSSGALTYSLQVGFPAGTSINSTTGVITIGGPGTINVLATQAASGNFAAVTTPVTVGTINVLGAPTITPATTQTIAYRQVNKVTVTPTSNSPGAFTYSLQTNTSTFSGFAVIDPLTGIVTLGGIGTINVFVTQAAAGVYSAVTTPVPAGTITVNYIAIPCFKEGTQILTIDGYRLIQDLRKGDLVKTLKHEYVPINTIGHQTIYNEKDKMIFDKIYKCTNENYPEIIEDLYITGLHAVLVDELTEEQQSNIKGIYNDSVFITDDKYRLPVCYDERSTLYETETVETVGIYHLALDNENENLNYGIYANGLLVETTSIRLMKESGLIMVE